MTPASGNKPLTFSFGTHNLHDEDGVPGFFADLIIFTEAIPKTIRGKARARWGRHVEGRLLGYRIIVPQEQKDLALAVRRDLFTPTRPVQYRLAHPGRAPITPHRGTARQEGILPNGDPLAIYWEHRINAAFPPYKRGNGPWRYDRWMHHTYDVTLPWIQSDLDQGIPVVAGGDLNTPEAVLGYDGVLDEVSRSLDRLAAGGPGVKIGGLSSGTYAGSDHRRRRSIVSIAPRHR